LLHLQTADVFTNDAKMKVSVVIPTYNRIYILREALESALAQTYCDFEILVVDDGSSDNTREIVESIKNDKIRYIRHDHNRGCSAAYNTGIKEATGHLIAFLDSDDVWKPEYLEHQVNFLTGHPEVGLVFCNVEVQGLETPVPSLISLMRAFPELLRTRSEAGEVVISARQMYVCLLQEVPIKPPAVVIRRELFDRVGLFDEAWPSGTDWDLFLRMSRVACFGYLDRVLVLMRRTPDSTSFVFRERDKVFLLDVFLKEKATLANDPDAIRSINRGMSFLYNSLGWSYLELGRNKQALATYFRGFKETLRPMLLTKLASCVFRVARESVTGIPPTR
jgi:glycosyltransferase involved in cell wall biosynthesis